MRIDRLFLPAIVAMVCLGWTLLGQAAEQADPPHEAGAHEAGADHEHQADGHGAEAHSGDPNPLAIDIDLAIWTGVVFAVLFFVLSKFAWPSISEALEEREKNIAGNIADAQANHEESKRILAEHEAKLGLAADEVRGLLEEARRDAEHTKAQIIADAKHLADQERERAVLDIKRAADTAMKTLAETSANLAVDLAGKVVKQNITPDQQASLVREALGKLAISSPSKN